MKRLPIAREEPVSYPYMPPTSRRRAARLGEWIISHVWAWLVPLLLSAAGTVGGYVVGYVKGLEAAAERIAAIEENVRQQGLKRATLDVRVKQLEDDRNWATSAIRDHDSRVGRVETALKLAPLTVRGSAP